MKEAVRAIVPIALVSVTRATYDPGGAAVAPSSVPSQRSDAAPAERLTGGRLRTIVPRGVSTSSVALAGRESRKRAVTPAEAFAVRGTLSAESVRSYVNVWST